MTAANSSDAARRLRALRLISAHKNIQHEARYAELLQGRIKVSVIGMWEETMMFSDLPCALNDLVLRGAISLIVCALAALCVLGGFVGNRRKSRAEGAIELRRSGRTVQDRKLRRQG